MEGGRGGWERGEEGVVGGGLELASSDGGGGRRKGKGDGVGGREDCLILSPCD